MTRPPIVKSVTVKCSPDLAFRYFTDDFSQWWPGSHSVVAYSSDHKETPAVCILETKNGGRVYEKASNGTEYEWGTIFLWDPPSRLAFSWHPGRPEDVAQTVEVTFTSTPDGTRVTLKHSGWEKLGEEAEESWKGYNSGWETVFMNCFAQHANQ